MLRNIFASLTGLRSNPARLRQTIATLEQQARSGPPATSAEIFKRLGDLCLSAGERKQALSYYGRGIDAHLVLGNYEAAAALCRKVIAAMPEVVRARCTLAFLSLRKGFSPVFERELKSYVQAAKRAGQAHMAIMRLRMMASVTHEDDLVRMLVDQQLAELGDTPGSYDSLDSYNSVGGGFGRDGRRSTPLRGDQRQRWALMLRLAITSPIEEDQSAA